MSDLLYVRFIFQNYLEKSNSQIETIVALVRGKLDPGIRVTLGALTVIDVHGNEITQNAVCFFSYSNMSFECRKTKTKVITLANQKRRRQPVNQSKLEVITRSRHKARENVHTRATIGFGFTSDWLTKWRENFEPITEQSNEKPMQFANYFRHSIENRSIVSSYCYTCTY